MEKISILLTSLLLIRLTTITMISRITRATITPINGTNFWFCGDFVGFNGFLVDVLCFIVLILVCFEGVGGATVVVVVSAVSVVATVVVVVAAVSVVTTVSVVAAVSVVATVSAVAVAFVAVTVAAVALVNVSLGSLRQTLYPSYPWDIPNNRKQTSNIKSEFIVNVFL